LSLSRQRCRRVFRHIPTQSFECGNEQEESDVLTDLLDSGHENVVDAHEEAQDSAIKHNVVFPHPPSEARCGAALSGGRAPKEAR